MQSIEKKYKERRSNKVFAISEAKQVVSDNLEDRVYVDYYSGI